MGLGRGDCFKIWERGTSSKKTERFEAGDLERGGGIKSYIRLRVVPHFSSGIVEPAKRERA